MVTNRRLAPLDNDGDLYPTPAWATHALFQHETFEGSIWEPAAGDGAMAKVIKHYYPDSIICATDLYDHDFDSDVYFQSPVNFLEVKKSEETFDNIITNPPYNIADDFINKSLEMANKKVAMLVRLPYLEGQKDTTHYIVLDHLIEYGYSQKESPSTKRAQRRKEMEPQLMRGLSGIKKTQRKHLNSNGFLRVTKRCLVHSRANCNSVRPKLIFVYNNTETLINGTITRGNVSDWCPVYWVLYICSKSIRRIANYSKLYFSFIIN